MPKFNDPASPNHSNHLISTNGFRAQRVWHHETPLFESTINELIRDWNRNSIEQCGFIDNEQDLWYIPNLHMHPRSNFLMDEESTTRALTDIYKNGSVLGIFHTHPNGVTWPSPRDIVGLPNPKLGWRYFIVTGSDVLEWELVRG